jgi:hypothetical protein
LHQCTYIFPNFCRYEDGQAEEFSPTSVEEKFRIDFYPVIDLTVACIQDRLNQEGYKAYSNLQQLLLLAARGEECSKIISKLADLYGDKNISGDGDLNKDRLFVQCASF